LRSEQSGPDALSRYEELRRGWRPLLACSIGVGFGLSPIPPYTAGIFATALHAQFNWPRGEILGAIMLLTGSLVLLGSSVGRLIDRVGARKVAVGSTIGLSVSIALMSTISANILSFYACWALMAVVALGTLPMTYAKVITGWFDSARGLALGICLASTGITGALFPFYLNWMIAAFGWRIAYLGLAALPMFIALPILLLWLREPLTAVKTATAKLVEGFSVREALRQYRFWASAIGGLCLGAATGGLMPNLFPLLTENGFPTAAATGGVATLAMSVTAGRLISGYLLDRLWAPLVAVILVIPALIAVLLLTLPGMGISISIAAVAVIGLVAGAEFDLIAYMTGRYFGRKHFSELYGIQYSVFGLGSGIAPAAYGAIRDATGSYHPTLGISAGLFVIAVSLLLSLGRYPARFAGLAPD
jgi:MFS family permease